MCCGRCACRSDYIIIFINSSTFSGEALPSEGPFTRTGREAQVPRKYAPRGKLNCYKAAIANYSKVSKIKLSNRDNDLLANVNLPR